MNMRNDETSRTASQLPIKSESETSLLKNIRKFTVRTKVRPGHNIFEGTVREGMSDRKKRLIWRLSLLLFVILPTILSAVYYTLYASEQFQSEARFVVRAISATPLQQGEGDDGAAIIPLPNSLNQDAHIIASYLSSDQFYHEMNGELDIETLFSRSDIDFFNRLTEKVAFDEKVKYLKKKMTIFVDGPSGIITVRARAFTPEEAQKIVQVALDRAEVIIDKISERAKTDLVERAEDEVRLNLAKFVDSLTELRRFQDETGILDPLGSAQVVSRLISGLTNRKLETIVEVEIAKNSGVSNNPRMRQLELLLKAIDSQISDLKGSLTQNNQKKGTVLSDTLVTFAELQTQRLLSEALYESSRRSLDTAKSTALRRTTFLAVFSRPKLAETKFYPKTLRQVAFVFVAMFILWSIAMLIIAAVEDHLE